MVVKIARALDYPYKAFIEIFLVDDNSITIKVDTETLRNIAKLLILS